MLLLYFVVSLGVECLNLLCDVLCVGCWGVFQYVALSDEVLNFWCEVGVVSFSVTSWNVFLVSVLDSFIEYVYSIVDVSDGCTV